MEIALIITALLIAAAAAIILIRQNRQFNAEKAVLKEALEKSKAEIEKLKALKEYEWKQLVESVAACAAGGENPFGLILLKKEGKRSYLNKHASRLFDWPESLCGYAANYDEIFALLKKLSSNTEAGTDRIKLVKENNMLWVDIGRYRQEDLLLVTAEDVTASVEAEERERYALMHDILTGFYKHETFINKLKDLFAENNSLGTACMVLFDIESLKMLNDNYGPKYVDEYISSFAGRIKSCFPQNSIFSRYSNSEFYAFVYGYSDENTIKQSIESLIGEFEKTVVKKGGDEKELLIKITAGLSWYPKDSINPEELLTYSNFSVYVRPGTTEDRIAEFSRERYLKEGYLINSREAFLQMIEYRYIKYAFQTIVDVSTAKVFGYEMLMRPKKTELSNPIDVLRLAKIHSKLHVIENITWFEAMRTYVEQIEKGTIPYNTKIFINSIGGVVLNDSELSRFHEDFYDYVKNIVIEITETEQNDEASVRKKRQIADNWKAMIALDDYGTGYNGEVSLLVFQPNIIKVDINIIHGVDQDNNRLNLLKNIIQYARLRDILVLAEGVNSREELKTVIECGVDLVQGHYIATPVFTPKDISAKLRREIGDFKHGV
jgi:diguanylate cyclase (GGDEF)-like protein